MCDDEVGLSAGCEEEEGTSESGSGSTVDPEEVGAVALAAAAPAAAAVAALTAAVACSSGCASCWAILACFAAATATAAAAAWVMATVVAVDGVTGEGSTVAPSCSSSSFTRRGFSGQRGSLGGTEMRHQYIRNA